MSKIKAAGTSLNVAWHISSYSANGSGQCVEVGPVLDGTARYAVRDSTQPHLDLLSFSSAEWGAFVSGVKAGEH